MSVSFSIVTPERSEEVVAFLNDVFGFSATPEFFSQPTLAWKYFAPHPWWSGGRSYALEVNGQLAAHACVTPVRFGTRESMVDSLRIIDWAAGQFAPGAGLLLFRRCVALGRGPLVMVGGSAETRQFVSQLKAFTKKPAMRIYARPLWPFDRFRRSSRTIRDWAKLARNAYWGVWPSLPSAGAWVCRPAFRDEPVFTPDSDFLPILRTREWVDYLLACPIGSCELLILEQRGVPSGHALVSHLSGSARVADFALGGRRSTAERVQAFAAVIHYLKDQGRCVELMTASSINANCEVFAACGLRFRTSSPVAAADPQGRLARAAELEVNLLLGDGFYVHDAERPFYA